MVGVEVGVLGGCGLTMNAIARLMPMPRRDEAMDDCCGFFGAYEGGGLNWPLAV